MDQMKAITATIQTLMNAANANHGRVLDAPSVQNVCRYIMAMEAASNELFVRTTQAENMLNAYMNEYGDELFDQLAPGEWFGQEVVDGEVVDEDEATHGLVYENVGVDAQVEGEEE